MEGGLTGKNVASVTDLDLYNGFVWVEQDGRAASMYYGRKILWTVVTGIEETEKWHIFARVVYAMTVALYSNEELKDMEVDSVKILVQPDGPVKPFLINANFSDAKHSIVGKLEKSYEGTRSYAIKNNKS